MEPLEQEIVTEHEMYAKGKANDYWIFLLAYDAFKNPNPGYTARQFAVLIQQETGEYVGESTAGKALNTIRKAFIKKDKTKYKVKVFKRKTGKTYELVYKIIHL